VAVARYHADGSLDAGFDGDGKVTTTFVAASRANGVVVQADGKVLVAGTDTLDVVLARYQSGGELDTTFGDGGRVVTRVGGWITRVASASAVALYGEDRLVVAGTASDQSPWHGLVARYLLTAQPVERFVTGLYQELLHRTPDAAGLQFWVGFMARGASTFEVAQAIATSLERRMLVVQGLYQRLLGRDAEAAGLQAWVQYLAAGHTAAEAEAGFLSSPEYASRHGGPAGFLPAVYGAVLNRAPDAAGRDAWQRRLDAGTSPAVVALGILHSTEARERMLQGLYHDFLDRGVDPSGHAHYLAMLGQGHSGEDVLTAIAGSVEFFVRMSAP
jgi:uncharacterized delta-60 repeat protein